VARIYANLSRRSKQMEDRIEAIAYGATYEKEVWREANNKQGK
jgi:hypothetical protein